jgi:hypothetical protein
VVARTAGILKNELPMATAEEERQATEQVIAEEAVRRMEA